MEQFIDEDWYGSYFELAIQFKNKLSDDLLRDCIHGLWSNDHLFGPCIEKENVGKGFIDFGLVSGEVFSNYLYGILTLADSTLLGCLSLTVREEEGSDWLDFCIPSGILEKKYSVTYPLIPEKNLFLQELETVFSEIAKTVYSISPFDMALIGEEVSGMLYVDSLTKDYVLKGGVIIPEKTAAKAGALNAGIRISSDLLLYPNKTNCF
ncbi:hypothetical protein [Paenibacillus lignilyticus]|uniref:Uncharacterized protein n=1 Tax=Paenibacillus lignilyticus TaxID=1172615 RepID=A0ABS5CN94_9BACL|nr:hypothetical protein [Paenibacillus lignilyticus]MBP3967324.1 hypothetical protein [Paenibacillus lignilyticus]